MKTIEVVSYPSDPISPKIEKILNRKLDVLGDVEGAVREILDSVRSEGDRAVAEFAARFDGVEFVESGYKVAVSELISALNDLDPNLRLAIEEAIENIRKFHNHQGKNSWFVEDGDGVILGKKITPIDRVGICVPAGKAPLFSSLIMCAVPAQIAGVKEICVVSPPRTNGCVDPVISATARLLGIEEVHAVGGAQAVAAMAYGTESIRRVDKIVGPGSPYTVAAQKQVFGLVGIPMLPGPSEIVVLADEGADPSHVAADMLSQAEHGWGVASVCITTSSKLGNEVNAELSKQLAELSDNGDTARALEEFGAIVIVDELDHGIELMNRLAPEHAELLVTNPWEWIDKVRHCGALFLGTHSTEPVGDYFAGTNHVLPTNGAARYASSLGVADFLKDTSIISYSEKRLKKVGSEISRLARAEGLEAHARAVEIRGEKS